MYILCFAVIIVKKYGTSMRFTYSVIIPSSYYYSIQNSPGCWFTFFVSIPYQKDVFCKVGAQCFRSVRTYAFPKFKKHIKILVATALRRSKMLYFLITFDSL